MKERTRKHTLPVGYRLGDHRIVDVLGVGGFGITYLAHDDTLDRRVAIKEYLPNEFAVRDGTTVQPKSTNDCDDFEWGLQRFLDEARTLARFRHPNLVRVVAYFEANYTAYIVMDYEEGEPLDKLLESHGRLTEAQLKRVLIPIVEGLKEVHAVGFLHRDIKPSNVFVRRSDETPVLLDFGAARQALGRKSKSLTAVASAGYSPPEQYESEGEQGPWTDVYSLSALCYRAITGNPPVEAPSRQSGLLRSERDPLPRLAGNAPGDYSDAFLEAVDWGLRVIETERPQSVDEWQDALSGGTTQGQSSSELPARTGVAAEPDSTLATNRRRRRATTFGAGGLAAAVIALFWWLYLAQPAPSLLDSAQRLAEAIDSAPAEDEPIIRIDQRQPSPLNGGKAILVVETEPAGVEVQIDGAPAGETPLQLRTVRAGTYPVTLRHPDYETVLLPDQRFADGEVLRIDRRLQRAMGKLTVITNPANVWIERDGERLSEGTPVTLEGLPAGTLELTLGADEYRSIRVAADVPKNGVGLLERTLEPIPFGTLTLELEPPNATVTLPDIAPAYRPGMRLPEGQHRVMVTSRGFRQAMRTLEVAGDTRERIELAIDPKPFTVVTMPADAVVQFMDVGDEYRDGILMNPGEYRIRVSAPEYETLEEDVVHGVEATSYSVTLARSPQPFTVVATPAEAVVSIVGLSGTYTAGMRLPPGEYRVQVAAEGFETQNERVRHGTDPTRHEVVLVRPGPQPGESFTDALESGGKGPEMVVIPAGKFRMGCLSDDDSCDDDENPIRDVQIPQPFALSRYEITFADWDACVSAGGCNGYRPNDEGWGRDRLPVINVSWKDAQRYLFWLSRQTSENYRLASEAEWEYAARAGTDTKYFWGDQIGHNRANCGPYSCGDAGLATSSVGAFEPNTFGLHDMHGNVWEWVEDCWNDNYHGAPSQGEVWKSGDCTKRVLRGGGWLSGAEDLRSANRTSRKIARRGSYSNFGFRVARTLTP